MSAVTRIRAGCQHPEDVNILTEQAGASSRNNLHGAVGSAEIPLWIYGSRLWVKWGVQENPWVALCFPNMRRESCWDLALEGLR